METPTAETIGQLHEHFDVLKDLQRKASDAIAAAQQNGQQEITIARDGKAVVVHEKDLWDEVWHLGSNSDAGRILKEKYPGAFALSLKAEEKMAEIKHFTTEKWGINPLAMSLSDILKLTGALIDYKLAQQKS